MIFPPRWGVTSHLCSPLCPGIQNLFFPSAGRHCSFFHPPHSGNGNDVPLARGKNLPPWLVRGAAQRANCLNEIPVCDEWEWRGLLGSQDCAAADLCPVQTLKASRLVLSRRKKIWNALADIQIWKDRCVLYYLLTSLPRHPKHFLTYIIIFSAAWILGCYRQRQSKLCSS